MIITIFRYFEPILFQSNREIAHVLSSSSCKIKKAFRSFELSWALVSVLFLLASNPIFSFGELCQFFRKKRVGTEVKESHMTLHFELISLPMISTRYWHFTEKSHRLQGVQGWRSGESTRLPPMWSGFDSHIRRHMLVEFVGSLLWTERFSPGTPVSPLLKNHHLNWFLLIVNLSLQCPLLVLQR